MQFNNHTVERVAIYAINITFFFFETNYRCDSLIAGTFLIYYKLQLPREIAIVINFTSVIHV